MIFFLNTYVKTQKDNISLNHVEPEQFREQNQQITLQNRYPIFASANSKVGTPVRRIDGL